MYQDCPAQEDLGEAALQRAAVPATIWAVALLVAALLGAVDQITEAGAPQLTASAAAPAAGTR